LIFYVNSKFDIFCAILLGIGRSKYNTTAGQNEKQTMFVFDLSWTAKS